ncbi:FtsX-like permease family protein [Maribellus comscasis]|uniref:FtsX-like permease family protein n=1 Tax=Maribellus comscasis TaxID=2681766 RepID=A0A6I6JZP5_9BACT|nr:ABC transporter permease [Maribellus comscasis]QGY44663.1 FtsX-like permease family protein [Maribellus comscasis]
MFRNYFLLTWRNIIRNKSFSVIKILGLAIAIAAFILIYQHLRYELSYDRFQSEANNIYRVTVEKEVENGVSYKDAYTFPALGIAARDEIPGVKNFFRLSPWANSYTVVYKDEKKNEPVSIKTDKAVFADAPFAKYFSLNFIVGGSDSLLAQPNNIYISNSVAEKYFGVEWNKKINPTGETLLVYTSNHDAAIPFKVCGIYQDMPSNSHLQYKMIMSHSSLTSYLPKEIPDHVKSTIFDTNWGNYSWYTYLVLDPTADPKTTETQLNQMVARHKNTNNLNESFFLQPVKDIHLKSQLANEASPNGSITNVYVMAGIGLLILILALVNYVNLSIAGFMERTEEIGIRQVIGSKKRQIVAQLFIEAFVFNLMAIIIGWIISKISAPAMSHITGIRFTPGLYNYAGGYLIFILFGLLLFGSVLASLYPSLMVASAKSIEKLKGHTAMTLRLRMNKYLLVFQFTVSIVLIIGTLINYKQINFMRNQDLGIDTDRIVVLEGPNAINQQINFEQTVQRLRNEVASYPSINQVSACSTVPGKVNVLSRPLFQLSRENEGAKEIREIMVDQQYFPMLDIKFTAGHNFPEAAGNKRQMVILNESAVRMLGFNSPEDAISQKVGYHWAGGIAECEVIGVVGDFHQQSLKFSKEPIGFYNELSSGDYMVKISSGLNPSQNISGSLDLLESKWQELFPDNPFNYYFLDNFFEQQYSSDKRFGSIFTLFSALGIFISCIGLFCLSVQSVAKRNKEIGIRKVNGAKISEILSMLNKDFVKWVLIACGFAIPVAWYAMNKWLENFAYKTSLSWWIFASAGLLALGIAMLTVSWQSWRAATRNPVETLRYE